MAWRIVKQPNGKYARFSEVVDDFTDYDMTREEVFENCMETFLIEAKRNAEVKVANADVATHRYKEAIQIVGAVHGESVARERQVQLEGENGASEE